MSTLALVWGVAAFCGFCVALIPCLGWLNWLNIPFSACGVVIAIVAMAKANNSGVTITRPLVGLVLSVCAVAVGLLRLLIGGGVV